MRIAVLILFALVASVSASRLPVGRISDFKGTVLVKLGGKQSAVTSKLIGTTVYRGDQVKCVGQATLTLSISRRPVQQFPMRSPGQWETVVSERSPHEKQLEDRLLTTLAKSRGDGDGEIRWPMRDAPASASHFLLLLKSQPARVHAQVYHRATLLWEGNLVKGESGFASAALGSALSEARGKFGTQNYRIVVGVGPSKTDASFTLCLPVVDEKLDRDLASAAKVDNAFIQMLDEALAYFEADQYAPAAAIIRQAQALDPENRELSKVAHHLAEQGFGG